MRTSLALCLGLRRCSQVLVCDAKSATEFRRLDHQTLICESGEPSGVGKTVLAFDGGGRRHADSQQKHEKGRSNPNHSHAPDQSCNHHICRMNAHQDATQLSF